ncbi:MAG: histidine kinase [Bacteroidota bacterium]
MSAKSSPPATLAARMLRAFFLTISVYAAFSFLSYHLERQLMLKSNEMLQTGLAWSRLAEDTERLEAALEKSLVTGDREARLSYESLAALFEERVGALVSAPIYSIDTLAVEDVLGMTATLLEQAGTAMAARQRQAFEEGNEAFRAFAATGEALRSRIHQAVVDGLRRENASYQRISKRIKFVGHASLALVLGGLSLAMILTYFLSRRLTHPLAELAAAAQRVARGDFSAEIQVNDYDEVGRVSEAFNQMSRSVAGLIRDLKEKSALEARLRQRELENLAMKNLIQETRLALLQSQINPHFFFNTLNVGVHLASLEKANRTALFFENVGRLFRYSLGKIETAATLAEELDHVGNYVTLLRMRFGENAFSFRQEVEAGLLALTMPRLTLQPLVENAYLHGLSGRSGGRIELAAFRTEAGVAIEIRDNGTGIPRGKLAGILRAAKTSECAGSHGLLSVIARLRLWTGNRRSVTFANAPGGGAIVRLLLPPRFADGGTDGEPG